MRSSHPIFFAITGEVEARNHIHNYAYILYGTIHIYAYNQRALRIITHISSKIPIHNDA